MKKKTKKPRVIPFNKELSYKLDQATIDAESGKASGKIRKRYIEWLIFGGRP